MKNSTKTYFEIKHGDATLHGKNDETSFKTQDAARHEAKLFKQDPRYLNPKMNDNDVRYWKSRTFIIIEKTVTTTIKEVI